MTFPDTAFFSEYRKPGNIEAIEVRTLKDGFVLRTYCHQYRGPEIIATPEELIAFRELIDRKIEDFRNR